MEATGLRRDLHQCISAVWRQLYNFSSSPGNLLQQGNHVCEIQQWEIIDNLYLFWFSFYSNRSNYE